MIGEPEMVGEDSGAPPTDVLSDAHDRSSGTGAGGLAGALAGRSARPWLWAVGGAAAASAVWAAVLHGTGPAGLDLHGYHLGGNPCDGASLRPLTDAVGGDPEFTASDATVSRGPALDRLSCLMGGATPAVRGWATDYTVTVAVELHRTTDPRAEFDNARQARVATAPAVAADSSRLVVSAGGDEFGSGTDVHPVTGLGDEAYLLVPRASDQTLEVLHGGAVFKLQVAGYSSWVGPGDSPAGGAEPPSPDLTRLRPAMVEAMRALMASLAT